MQARRCGVLCHPTSLPGPYGIGDLGTSALQFIDFLAQAGQTVWQVLPLGPTGYGDSPYQPFSAFAGNPLLIALDELVEEGLLSREELSAAASLPAERVDYGQAIALKDRALRASYTAFRARASSPWHDELDAFCQEQSSWLDDYALFMALKLRFAWSAWTDWEPGIALRQSEALAYWRRELAEESAYQRYLQFLFERQWQRVKAYASSQEVAVIGDMPIFVGHDSADVWAHRELFYLDDAGKSTVVAGVPPDYFSPTGQRWGNPLYRWDVMAAQGYAWWVQRLRHALVQVDEVRLDHFRGFAGYWEVPAQAETAIAGRWVQGPGEDFFRAMEGALGQLPIIAEDLGLISVDVEALRAKLDLPGMRVLQFAFDSDALNVHLPHNHPVCCVVYTGTHDNDTTAGWYAALEEKTRHRVRLYTGSDGQGIAWTFIRLVYSSVANTAIVPLQDILGLGSEARLNQPGRSWGNWCWRFTAEALRPETAAALRDLAEVTGRWRDLSAQAEPETPLVLDYEQP